MTGILIVLVVFAIIFAMSSINIVRQYEKGLVETLGKYSGPPKDSGPIIIIPIFQRIIRVDMRERVIDVPPQSVITKENAPVTVDAVIYFQVTDPKKVVYEVENFAAAALNLAQTNLRNVIGEMDINTILTSREKINTQLRIVLDDATDKWGVKVTRVEIKKIDPPRDITDAMSKLLKADREKNANILEAEGFKRAAILKAEGAKQAVILEAEAFKEKQVLEATGQAEAIKKVADAEKYQIELVYGAIHAGKPTNDLIAIKYLEALGKVADGQATKIFLPLETTGVTASIGGVAELFKDPVKLAKTIEK